MIYLPADIGLNLKETKDQTKMATATPVTSLPEIMAPTT